MRKIAHFLGTSAAITLLCAILLVTSPPIHAEDSPAKLSLADAVSLALSGNPNLKQAEKDYQSSLSRLRIAGFTTSYGVGGYTGLEREPGYSSTSGNVYGDISFEGLSGATAALALSPIGIGANQSSLGLSLRQPLIQGKGRLSRKADLALAATAATSIESKQLFMFRQSMVTDVANAYYQAVMQQKRVRIQERALEIASQAEKAARRKVEAGLIPGLEASRAKLNLARTEDDLNDQRRSARTALDRLMIAIGSGVGQTPELADTEAGSELETPVLDQVIQRLETPGLEEAMRIALENRSELKVADEQVAEQTRRLDIAKDKLKPGLDAVMGYSSSDTDEGLASGSLFTKGALTVGMEYRIPLDKRRDVEERDIAKRDLGVLRNLREYEVEQIREEVRNAYRAVESDRASLKINVDNRNAAEENLRLAQRMVDEGLKDNREILEAKESLSELESSLISAKVNLFLDNLRLKRAMGEDLTTVVTK
ncbi:MAG: TolC family protein [Armatimonadota bacterium]|nr:TolC family protein [Armatimonadota bacterium]